MRARVEETLQSGDQNLFWDAPLKIALLAEASYKVLHNVHTADVFSRPPEKGRGKETNGAKLSKEAYRPDGNYNCWTATVEAAPFLGRMAIHPDEFVTRGVNFKSLTVASSSLDNAVEELTAGDWLGVHHSQAERVAHGFKIKEIIDAYRQLRKTLLKNMRESVEPAHGANVIEVFSRLFCLDDYVDKDWPFAALSAVERMLEDYPLDKVRFTTSVDEYSAEKLNNKASSFLPLFLQHYPRACQAYNEAIKGEGRDAMSSLTDGQLPFYAVVKNSRGELVRIDLEYQDGDTLKNVVERTAKQGSVIALLGKANILLIEHLMKGPLVLPEGGSSYSPKAFRFVTLFREATGVSLPLHPLLRLRFHALDALADIPGAFRLPNYLREAFSSEWITGAEFAREWRSVVARAESEADDLAGTDIVGMIPKLFAKKIVGETTVQLLGSIQERLSRYNQRQKEIFEYARDSKQLSREESLQWLERERSLIIKLFEPDVLKAALATLSTAVETKRAEALRTKLAIATSLRYWNCRPFAHWVFSIPGWYEGIRQHFEVVEDNSLDA